MLDACFFNGHYWTKLLGVSDRACADAEITVTDTCSSAVQVYDPLASTSFADLTAFPTSFETCGLFADGFESGTTTAWIAATPP